MKEFLNKHRWLKWVLGITGAGAVGTALWYFFIYRPSLHANLEDMTTHAAPNLVQPNPAPAASAAPTPKPVPKALTKSQKQLWLDVFDTAIEQLQNTPEYTGLSNIKQADVDDFVDTLKTDVSAQQEIFQYGEQYNLSLEESIISYVLNQFDLGSNSVRGRYAKITR